MAQDVKGITPLMLAAQSGETTGMRMLIAYGALLDSRDHKGQTALHYAAGSGSTDATSLLLEHRADPFRFDRQAPTALRVAERQGHKAVEDLILKALEVAGRLIRDPRWPEKATTLTLRELQHGYKVVDKGGRPSMSSQNRYSLPAQASLMRKNLKRRTWMPNCLHKSVAELLSTLKKAVSDDATS